MTIEKRLTRFDDARAQSPQLICLKDCTAFAT